MTFRTDRPRVDGKCERDCILVVTGVFLLGLLLGSWLGYQGSVFFSDTLADEMHRINAEQQAEERRTKR